MQNTYLPEGDIISTEENKISEEHPGALVRFSGLLMQNIPCRWQGMLLYG